MKQISFTPNEAFKRTPGSALTVLAFICLGVLFSIQTSSARILETYDECVARYGKPINRAADGTYNFARRENPVVNDALIASISITFADNKATTIEYTLYDTKPSVEPSESFNDEAVAHDLLRIELGSESVTQILKGTNLEALLSDDGRFLVEVYQFHNRMHLVIRSGQWTKAKAIHDAVFDYQASYIAEYTGEFEDAAKKGELPSGLVANAAPLSQYVGSWIVTDSNGENEVFSAKMNAQGSVLCFFLLTKLDPISSAKQACGLMGYSVNKHLFWFNFITPDCMEFNGTGAWDSSLSRFTWTGTCLTDGSTMVREDMFVDSETQNETTVIKRSDGVVISKTTATSKLEK